MNAAIASQQTGRRAGPRSCFARSFNFELGGEKMQVREVMTADPACCIPKTGLQEVAQLMVDHDCGEIPVVENAQTKLPIGVITDRDIVCRAVAQGLNPLDLTAADCMSKP